MDVPTQPLSIQRRADLTFARHRYQGEVYYVAKDPVSQRYFRLHEEEYALLTLLDGKRSADEVCEQFARRFRPQRISHEELAQFLADVRQNGLVIGDTAGEGARLLAQRRTNARKRRFATVTNPLYIRLFAVDPDRFLTWLTRGAGWLFSPAVVAFHVALMSLAGLLIATQWDAFTQRLPEFSVFFGPHNWLPLAVTVLVTKLLHELGHGVSCKRYGGECHEMGVLLLVLMPLAYCNVSDTSMLPSKWKRAFVGAAGIYVEMTISAYCAFLWWFSAPGPLHYLCLNVLFVSSVSTLLLNANPLLRYDGYYILSDLAEIPNLRQKAQQATQRWLAAWAFGTTLPEDTFAPRRGRAFFVLYAVAAASYRWMIAASILLFLYKLTEPYDLKVVGQTIAIAAAIMLLVMPLVQTLMLFTQLARRSIVKPVRLMLFAAQVSAVGLAVFFLPLPDRQQCSFETQPDGAENVYVPVGGTLTSLAAKPGDRVDASAPIANLADVEAEIVLAQLEGKRNALVARLTNLQRKAYTDDAAALELTTTREDLAAIDEQIARRRKELELLTVRAPVAGEILPAPKRPPALADEDGQLPPWSGDPLCDRNLGATFTPGVLLCRVGDSKRLHAALAVDESQIEFVKCGDPVTLQIEGLPGRVFRGKIERISESDQEVSARLDTAAGGDIATRRDAAGRRHALTAKYQAIVPLDNAGREVLLGARGQAVIQVGYRTISQRLWRSAKRTFRFEL